jgi:hypothetical protein
MAGHEGEGPRGEPTPQQPKQPEQTQPLQGRAEGRERLQGPTTVDQSEPPRRTVFENCILSSLRIDPLEGADLALVRLRQYEQNVDPEDAEAKEKEWHDSLKTMGREILENMIKESVKDLKYHKERIGTSKEMENDRVLAPAYEEQISILQSVWQQHFGDKVRN